MTTRQLFLVAGSAVADLLALPAVAEHWQDPSVLDRMTVGELAGHLSRSILQVENYLDGPLSEAAPIDSSSYYLRLDNPTELDSDLNMAVRQRAAQVAGGGPEAVADAARGCLERLAVRLPAEPLDRRVEAFGSVLLLDGYLETRLVEMTVHHDDLRCTPGINAPHLPDQALDVAINVMVKTAVLRHGRPAVLTALTRRERDTVQALRVL